jgi:hypothetical protein
VSRETEKFILHKIKHLKWQLNILAPKALLTRGQRRATRGSGKNHINEASDWPQWIFLIPDIFVLNYGQVSSLSEHVEMALFIPLREPTAWSYSYILHAGPAGS